MRPFGGRPSGAKTKNRTLGARSGPPVGHRQPRPPDVGAPQNPKFNRHVLIVCTQRNPLLPTGILYYPPKFSVFTKFTKDALGARSGPPVGHRQPRPPDVGAPQNPKFNRHVLIVCTQRNPLLPTKILYYPPKFSVFTKFTKDAPPASRSGLSLAIHTPPSSDTNDRLHRCTQNTRLYSYKLYCRCVLAAHGRSHAIVVFAILLQYCRSFLIIRLFKNRIATLDV